MIPQRLFFSFDFKNVVPGGLCERTSSSCHVFLREYQWRPKLRKQRAAERYHAHTMVSPNVRNAANDPFSTSTPAQKAIHRFPSPRPFIRGRNDVVVATDCNAITNMIAYIKYAVNETDGVTKAIKGGVNIVRTGVRRKSIAMGPLKQKKNSHSFRSWEIRFLQ